MSQWVKLISADNKLAGEPVWIRADSISAIGVAYDNKEDKNSVGTVIRLAGVEDLFIVKETPEQILSQLRGDSEVDKSKWVQAVGLASLSGPRHGDRR